MFRVIASTENEFKFSKFGKIDFKVYTYFTEEDAYLPFDRKKSESFQTLRYVDLRLMLDGKLMLSIPSTLNNLKLCTNVTDIL